MRTLSQDDRVPVKTEDKTFQPERTKGAREEWESSLVPKETDREREHIGASSQCMI